MQLSEFVALQWLAAYRAVGVGKLTVKNGVTLGKQYLALFLKLRHAFFHSLDVGKLALVGFFKRGVAPCPRLFGYFHILDVHLHLAYLLGVFGVEVHLCGVEMHFQPLQLLHLLVALLNLGFYGFRIVEQFSVNGCDTLVVAPNLAFDRGEVGLFQSCNVILFESYGNVLAFKAIVYVAEFGAVAHFELIIAELHNIIGDKRVVALHIACGDFPCRIFKYHSCAVLVSFRKVGESLAHRHIEGQLARCDGIRYELVEVIGFCGYAVNEILVGVACRLHTLVEPCLCGALQLVLRAVNAYGGGNACRGCVGCYFRAVVEQFVVLGIDSVTVAGEQPAPRLVNGGLAASAPPGYRCGFVAEIHLYVLCFPV